MLIKFSKMHGLGNDFIVINNIHLTYNLTTKQIAFLANRKLGIGCDQLLIVEPSTDGISDFFYRIYNSDGSEANQCGNGARCFIKYVIDKHLTSKAEICLQTNNQQIFGQCISADIYKINMGIPNFSPQGIPLNLPKHDSYSISIDGVAINFYALSMGNPHAVILLDAIETLADDTYLIPIAKYLQQSQLFPDSVNVNFVYILDKSTIKLRTYERVCGFTLACGSGACASVAATIIADQTANQVQVLMPGGSLKIDWQPKHQLFMQGSATFVFDGVIELC